MAKRPTTDFGKLNSHDDPVVVDNGPVRVDFGGGKHRPRKGSNTTWLRQCTPFAQLVVTVIPLGSEPETHTFALARDKPIVLNLQRGGTGGPATGKMTLTPMNGEVEVKSEEFEHELDHPTTPRFLRSDSQQKPLIASITLHRRSGRSFTFRPSGTPGSRVLVVSLVPVPE